jgi:hypothetical protein
MTDQQPYAPRAVHAAIVQVMDEVGREGVSKGHTADFNGQKRAYRGIDDIYNALNRAMVRAKLAIIPSVVEKNVERFAGAPNQYGKVTTTHVYSMVIDYKVICAVDSSHEIMRIFIEGFDTSDKGTGKAFSYAYKCGVLQLFCIPVEGQEDQDAHDPKIERPTTDKRQLANAVNSRQAPAKSNQVSPGVPAIGGKKHPKAGQPISVLSDDEVVAYIRQMMHVAESPKWAAEMAPKIAEAKAWATAARGITDFSKRQQDRSEQLKAAVDGDEYNHELYLCVHPKWQGEDIRWFSVEVLSDYLGWLDTWVNPTQTARKLLVERCIAKLAEQEAARIEAAMAAGQPAVGV